MEEFDRQSIDKDVILIEIYNGDTDQFLGEGVINPHLGTNQEVVCGKTSLFSRIGFGEKNTAGTGNKKPMNYNLEEFTERL